MADTSQPKVRLSDKERETLRQEAVASTGREYDAVIKAASAEGILRHVIFSKDRASPSQQKIDQAMENAMSHNTAQAVNTLGSKITRLFKDHGVAMDISPVKEDGTVTRPDGVTLMWEIQDQARIQGQAQAERTIEANEIGNGIHIKEVNLGALAAPHPASMHPAVASGKLAR